MSSIPSKPASLAARDKMLFLTTANCTPALRNSARRFVASSTVIPK